MIEKVNNPFRTIETETQSFNRRRSPMIAIVNMTIGNHCPIVCFDDFPLSIMPVEDYQRLSYASDSVNAFAKWISHRECLR